MASDSVYYNDVISLHIEDYGYMSIPSLQEPLQEYNDYCTQLRILPINDDIDINNICNDKISNSFHNRCLFRITSANSIHYDKKQVQYGDEIRLMHEPTGLYLQSTGRKNMFDSEESSCIYLCSDKDKIKDINTIWIISSEYRFRRLEDEVCCHDYITLKSLSNEKYINSISIALDKFVYDHLLSLSNRIITKGFQIKVISSNFRNNIKVNDDCIRLGDYITIWHTELKGLVISRVDDEQDLLSEFSPIGRTCRTFSKPKHHTHGTYIRSCNDNFSKLYDSLYQILPAESIQSIGNPLHVSEIFLLRHVVSGLFIAFRNPISGDSSVLLNESCIRLNESSRVVGKETICIGMTETIDSTTSFCVHSVDSSISSKVVLYSENLFFQNINTSMTFSFNTITSKTRWFEYINDFPMKPAFESRGNVLKFQKVCNEFLKEVIFTMKLIPSCTAAIACTQLNDNWVVNVPILIQFHLTLRTLLRFITGEADPSITLIEPVIIDEYKSYSDTIDEEKCEHIFVNTDGKLYFPTSNFENDKDEISLDTLEYIPAISYWLGREINGHRQCRYKFRDNEADLSREESIKYRQHLISDCRFIDHCIHFVNICFILSRSSEYDNNDNNDFPPELISCCKLVTKLLTFCCFKNSTVSKKIASTHGTLMSFICQHISGWLSPIEAILEELDESNNAQLLTSDNLIHIVDQMDDLKKRGYIDEALLVIQLISALFSSDVINSSNNIITDLILPTYFDIDSNLSEFDSVLFKTRLSDNGIWEINFDVKVQTLVKYSESDAVFIKEIKSFRDFFKNYNTTKEDSNNNNHEGVRDEVLDFFECLSMLEDLGFAGKLLRDELSNLEGSTEVQFLQWWLSKKNFLVTSSFSSLHRIDSDKILEVFRSLDADECQILASPMSQFSDKWSTQGLWEQETNEVNTNELKFQRDSSSFWDRVLKLRIPLFSIPSIQESPNIQSSVEFRANKINDSKLLSGWTSIVEVLLKPSLEREWIRNSFKLFSDISRGHCYMKQLRVGRLLPAEMLLDILSNKVSIVEKGLIYTLILEVYINHDFVFCTSSVLDSSRMWIGLNEDDLATITNFSDTFNQFSRHLFCKSEEGFILRSKLKECIRADLILINLNSFVQDETVFAFSLQKVILELLKREFFGKLSDYPKSGNKEYLFDSMCCSTLLEATSVTKDFDASFILLILIEKLQYKNDLKVLQDIMATNDDESFDNVRLKFKKLYSDPFTVKSKMMSLSILEFALKVKQVGKLGQLSRAIGELFNKRSIGSYADIKKQLDNDPSVKKSLSSIFESEEEDRIRHILHASLHSHYELQDMVYKFIYHDMNPSISILSILPKVKFTSTFQNSFVSRLAEKFSTLLQHYLGIFNSSDNIEIHGQLYTRAISYVLDCLRCLVIIHQDGLFGEGDDSGSEKEASLLSKFFLSLTRSPKQCSASTNTFIEIEADSDIEFFHMNAYYTHNDVPTVCFKQVLGIVISLTQSKINFDDYDEITQEIIDKFCLSLATIIRGNFDLCNACYQSELLNFILQNWDTSDGLLRLTQVLFETCISTEEDDRLKEFTSIFTEKCKSSETFSKHIFTFRSVMKNKNIPGLHSACVEIFLSRELYRLIPIEVTEVTVTILPVQLCLIQILVLVLESSFCNDSSLLSIRNIFSESFCYNSMNLCKSLVFRGYILRISSLLHGDLLLASSVLHDMNAIEVTCYSTTRFLRYQYCIKEYINCVVSILQQVLKIYMNDRTLLSKTNKFIKNQLKGSVMEYYFYFNLPDVYTPQQLPSLSYIYCQCLICLLDLLLASSVIIQTYNDIKFQVTIFQLVSLTLVILESTFDQNNDMRNSIKKRGKIITDTMLKNYDNKKMASKLDLFCKNDIRNAIQSLISTENERRLNLNRRRDNLKCMEMIPNDVSDDSIRSHSSLHILNQYLCLCRRYISTDNFRPNDTEISYKTADLKKDFLLKLKSDDYSSVLIIVGSMMIKNLLLYIGKGTIDNHQAVLLRLLVLLLDDKTVSISDSNHYSSRQQRLIMIETKELQQKQLALSGLGVLTLIYELICSSSVPTFSSSLTLLLCTKTIKGNSVVKTMLMQTIENIDNTCSHLSKGFCTVIHQLLKHCVSQLSRINWSNLNSQSSSSLDTLTSISNILHFFGVFCEGQNSCVQLFIREQKNCKVSIDLVTKIAIVIEALLMVIESNTNYITNPIFTQKLAPTIPYTMKPQKRKFIAWHVGDLNYSLITKLLITTQIGFSAVKELCQLCIENQNLIVSRISKCWNVLEFLGAMQLNEAILIKRGYYSTAVTWKGYNIADFYGNYSKELKRLNGISNEETTAINTFLDNKLQQCNILKLIKVGQRTETALLKMILSLIESGELLKINSVCSNMNEPTMMQNMNTYYKLRNQRNLRTSSDGISELAVLYYSTISAASSAKYNNGGDSIGSYMISRWEDSHAVNSFVASVEIIDSCDRITTIFFDIPLLVMKYWSYPETQKIKSDIKWNVTRTSPEEKLYSFYQCMNELIHVMRRQKRLSKALTPLIHSIFGGKSFIDCAKVIPKQRLCFLFLTMLLNLYYGHLSFSTVYLNGRPRSFASFWSPYVLLLAILHTCLGTLLLMRHILNSRAADHLIHKESSYATLPFTALFKVLIVASDAWWPITLLGCSIIALLKAYYPLYSLCLLDAIPQLRFMTFLVIAIKKNLIKVLFTILLAIILLYLIAVITYTFFADQYSFNGHVGCDTFFNCFKLHVDYGLQNYPNWQDEGTIQPVISGIGKNTGYIGRLSSSILGTIYNLSYVILFNLVLQAILAGLIIDAFTRMREENDRIEHDMISQCFICSINREEFEHNGISYHHHLKREHNMWQYVWFSIYINEKDPTKMSGTEHYAYHMMQDKQSFVKLIPIKRSLSIERKK